MCNNYINVSFHATERLLKLLCGLFTDRSTASVFTNSHVNICRQLLMSAASVILDSSSAHSPESDWTYTGRDGSTLMRRVTRIVSKWKLYFSTSCMCLFGVSFCFQTAWVCANWKWQCFQKHLGFQVKSLGRVFSIVLDLVIFSQHQYWL